MNRILPMAAADAIVIFGATGDLAQKKLYKALLALHKSKKLPKKFQIIGIGRKNWSNADFKKFVKKTLSSFPKEFSSMLSYHQQSFEEHEGYSDLAKKFSVCNHPIFYLATSPSFFPIIAKELHDHDVARHGRVMFEKPFGRDLASAKKLNKELQAIFDEEHLYRLDHYLGKDSVQNLLILRFANTIFEKIWNRDYIDNIQITVAEDIGIGDRGPGYYDNAGALRDMIQNHLLQILSYVLMEPPASLNADAIQDEKVKALKNLSVKDAVFGQYTGNSRCKGYTDAPGIAKTSKTETYVALKCGVNNYRWQGVPLLLRTGKQLPEKIGKITITFKHVPCVLFNKDDPLADNQLVVELQPEQKISLRFNTKKPGEKLVSVPVDMDFFHGRHFIHNTSEAYEEIIYAAIHGDKSHFTRWDEVETQWKVIENLLEKPPKLCKYKAGTWGPKEADKLLEGRKWQ